MDADKVRELVAEGRKVSAAYGVYSNERGFISGVARELADACEALLKRVAELGAERDDWKAGADVEAHEVDLRGVRIAELEAALENAVADMGRWMAEAGKWKGRAMLCAPELAAKLWAAQDADAKLAELLAKKESA